jgi:hypothetical protein
MNISIHLRIANISTLSYCTIPCHNVPLTLVLQIHKDGYYIYMLSFVSDVDGCKYNVPDIYEYLTISQRPVALHFQHD